MRTVARRWTEGSARKAASAGLHSYSSPRQLFGVCSSARGLRRPSKLSQCGWASPPSLSGGEPNAAATPFLTKPWMPAGLGRKRWPWPCNRRNSNVAASCLAASRTLLGARGLPACTTENPGSRSRWLSSHSTAVPTAPSGASSGAPAKRQAQDIAASAKPSSAGVPRSLPSRVPCTMARPSALVPPKAKTCASRRPARGLARVTEAGCTCLAVSGTSTGGCGGISGRPAAPTRWRTIFRVRPGVKRSFAKLTGFPSPRPRAA
mmetsp:Transcript_23582/g.74293  ORF Transcript_23582/g.74293 Transcript_23582/m.74293 type:complete len:263 (+) Transcript_23582:230-1018(+)